MVALLARDPAPGWSPIRADIHSHADVPLDLEPLDVRHAADYARLYRADPRIPELVWLPSLRTRRATETWIRREARKGGWEPFAIIHRELGLVGAISLVCRGPIGAFWFWIGAEHRRRGFGTHALGLLERRAVEHHRVEGLVALVLAINAPSRRVLRASGLRETGLTVLPRRDGVLLYASAEIAETPSLSKHVGALLTSIDADVRLAAPKRRKAAPSPQRETRCPVSALMAHLRGAGAVVAPLDVDHPSPDCRGIRAAGAIPSNTAILSIPLASLLTIDVARDSLMGRALASSGAELNTPQSLLAAFLLHERRNPRSTWRPYLDTLPTSFSTFPLLFEKDDLALLEGSMMLAKIEARRASIRQDEEVLRAHVPAFRRFSSASFLRARITVTSRIFGLTIGDRKTEALVPLADMLNHREPPETHWTYDEETSAFVMTALRPFAAGKPVHDSYGRKCNSRFFLSYGFALEDNEDDEARVELGASARGFQISARPDDDRAREALSFLRAACATEGEQGAANGNETPPLSARNETAALRALAAACEAALRGFPTTIEQDDALLAEGRSSPRARLCIIQRRGEKRVLRAWIDLVAQALPILRLPWARLVHTVRERSGDTPLDRHLRSIVSALTERRRAEQPFGTLDEA